MHPSIEQNVHGIHEIDFLCKIVNDPLEKAMSEEKKRVKHCN